MKTKRLLNQRWILWLFTPACCLPVGVLIGQLSSDAKTPYTVTGVVRQFYPSGDLYYTDTFVKCVRGDGSRSSQTTRVGNIKGRMLPLEKRDVLDTRERRATSIDVATRSISTVPLSGDEVSRLAARRPEPCAVAKDGVTVEPSTPLLGRAVVKVTTELKTQHGKRIVAQTWLAPSANCASLREVISEQQLGDFHVIKEMEVTSIVMGEPDAALFIIPEGYSERPPGEVSSSLAAQLGMDCPACAAAGQNRADIAYRTKRSAAGWK